MTTPIYVAIILDKYSGEPRVYERFSTSLEELEKHIKAKNDGMIADGKNAMHVSHYKQVLPLDDKRRYDV